MPDSIATQIVNVIKARLATITEANGYASDVGLNVFDGEPEQGPNAPRPMIMLGLPDESGIQQSTNRQIRITLGISLLVVMTKTVDDATDGQDLLADIKKAVMLADQTLGNIAHELHYLGATPVPRDRGKTDTGFFIQFNVIYSQAYSDPAATI